MISRRKQVSSKNMKKKNLNGNHLKKKTTNDAYVPMCLSDVQTHTERDKTKHKTHKNIILIHDSTDKHNKTTYK